MSNAEEVNSNDVKLIPKGEKSDIKEMILDYIFNAKTGILHYQFSNIVREIEELFDQIKLENSDSDFNSTIEKIEEKINRINFNIDNEITTIKNKEENKFNYEILKDDKYKKREYKTELNYIDGCKSIIHRKRIEFIISRVSKYYDKVINADINDLQRGIDYNFYISYFNQLKTLGYKNIKKYKIEVE